MNPTTDHPTSELLALHAGGDLTVADAQVVIAHLASCEFWRVEVSELSFSIETVRAMAVEPDESAARNTAGRRLAVHIAASDSLEADFGGRSDHHRCRSRGPLVRAVSCVASTREVVAHVAPTQTSRNERSKTPGLAVKEQIGPRRGRSPRQIPAGSRGKRVGTSATVAGLDGAETRRSLKTETEAGEPTELRLVSSNPRVVVLWQISDTNASPEETGTEGINKQ